MKHHQTQPNRKKICLISSSGGHFEQLKMLRKLSDKYDIYVITEKTQYAEACDYTLLAPHKNKIIGTFRFFLNACISLFYLLKENPVAVISTGTKVAFPTIVWAKLLGKKVIYIETFARVYGGTRTGKFVYKHHLYDLFIYQWETQKEEYPNGVYGGGIY